MVRNLPQRKQNRMEEYDYSLDGAYFVTICIKNKEQIFWDDVNVGADIIRPWNYRLSKYGKIVDTAINAIHDHYPTVYIDKYVIMPDHIHMIIVIDENNKSVLNMDGGRLIAAPTLSVIVGQLKRVVSKQIGFSIWQKSYHDHIIRNVHDYNGICRYIDENPKKYEAHP